MSDRAITVLSAGLAIAACLAFSVPLWPPWAILVGFGVGAVVGLMANAVRGIGA